MIVLDTNIALDLLLFRDPGSAAVEALLALGRPWLATDGMHEEMRRVLAYPHLACRLQAGGLQADEVLADWSARTQRVAAPPKAQPTCSDRADQMFIDLAVAHRALLLSKDRAVLRMARRLRAWGVEVRAAP